MSLPVQSRWQRRRRELAHETPRGLRFAAVSGNFAHAPDDAANRPTGDLWMYADFEVVDLTAAATQTLHGRFANLSNDRCEYLGVSSNGVPILAWSTDGTGTGQVNRFASATLASVGIRNRERVQLYATLDVDDGASGHAVEFWWRRPGGTFAQLGSTQTVADTTSVFAGTSRWEACGIAGGASQLYEGLLYRAAMGTGLTVLENIGLDVQFLNRNRWATDLRSLEEEGGLTVTVVRT